MKVITKVLLLTLLLTGSAYTFAKSHESGNKASSEMVDRHLSGFNAIDVAGSYDVYITQGTTESVKVEAPAEVMEHIITEVKGSTLKIYNKHDTWDWHGIFGNRKNKVRVYVNIRNVNAIALTGSGDVFFKEGIKADKLKLTLIGSGDLTGEVHAKSVECSITGSGDVRIAGSAETSAVQLSGSGDYSGRDLQTANTAVHVGGSGDARVSATVKVDASLSGSGDIYISGGAKNVSTSKSGSGDIHRS